MVFGHQNTALWLDGLSLVPTPPSSPMSWLSCADSSTGPICPFILCVPGDQKATAARQARHAHGNRQKDVSPIMKQSRLLTHVG